MAEYEPIPLRDKQLVDLAFEIAERRSGVLHDPGVGKTPPLGVMAYYVWTEEGKRTVIVQPSSIMRKNWKEVLRFTKFRPEDVVVIDGGAGDGTTENGTATKKQEQMASDAKVFLMTGEHWRRHWEKMVQLHPDIGLFIADEWHTLYSTHPKQKQVTHRTNQLYLFFQKKRNCRLIAATGSLIDGRLDSAYPLIHLIEPRYYGSHAAFMNMHAIRDEYGTVTGWQGHERIARIIGKHAIRRTFAEEYGPEAKIMFYERIAMMPKMRAAYDEFDKKACLELDRYILDGTEPGVATIRARQISAHPETFGLCQDEDSGKDQRLMLHMEDQKAMDRQPAFVVFSSLIPEVERLYEKCTAMGFKMGMMTGNISPGKRAKISEAYEERKLDGLVVTLGTAAVGYNWHHSTDFFLQTLDYKDTNFLQAVRRGIRGVREHPLRLWVKSYERSVDQRVEGIITRKSIDAHKVDATREIIRFRNSQMNDDGGDIPFEAGDPNFLLAY